MPDRGSRGARRAADVYLFAVTAVVAAIAAGTISGLSPHALAAGRPTIESPLALLYPAVPSVVVSAAAVAGGGIVSPIVTLCLMAILAVGAAALGRCAIVRLKVAAGWLASRRAHSAKPTLVRSGSESVDYAAPDLLKLL